MTVPCQKRTVNALCASTQVAIIGSGPTGLGAALRLLELGVHDFVIVDSALQAGGLASSCVDEHGFTWDMGGHVQFSHYQKFDEYMDLAFAPEEWLWHERESWIWTNNGFIPYPFQYNLHRLAPPQRWEAVRGLILRPAARLPENFEQWILTTFGSGIADLFMLPYNRKVWAHPLNMLDYRWVGERVAVVSLEQALKSVCTGEDQVSWGPNRRFRFPRRGGTGAIWRSLANRIPRPNLKLGRTIDRICPATRTIFFSATESFRYEWLINTAPLNWLTTAIGASDLESRTEALKLSTVHVLGIGLQGLPPDSIRKMCWMYFPGPETSFYRVTVFSNYSPENVPLPGSTWSLMAEVAESPHAPRDRATLLESVISQMVAIGLVPRPEDIISTWHRILPYGYPTPSLERDTILADTLPVLEERRILSRGRFGAWKYEVSNQDHSFMQGVEAVDHILLGSDEPTLNQPDQVNQRYNQFPYKINDRPNKTREGRAAFSPRGASAPLHGALVRLAVNRP